MANTANALGAPPTNALAATTTNQASLTTNTLTTQSQAVPSQPAGINFYALEENINKWTIELEEQEKLFSNQATQVNAWDSILLKNGQKIVELNKAVEKVKADQTAMEQELEFISAQHAELEESIVPLEQELSKMPQQVDAERSQTYLMAETLDSQLKQMSEDLKEVIEHLNEANKFSDPGDPMVSFTMFQCIRQLTIYYHFRYRLARFSTPISHRCSGSKTRRASSVIAWTRSIK